MSDLTQTTKCQTIWYAIYATGRVNHLDMLDLLQIRFIAIIRFIILNLIKKKKNPRSEQAHFT